MRFTGWREAQRRGWVLPENFEELIAWEPRTWLLREGWKRHGLISVHEVPAQGPVALR